MTGIGLRGLGRGILCLSMAAPAAMVCRADEQSYGTFAGPVDGGREITLVAAKRYLTSAVEGFVLERASWKIALVRGEHEADGTWVLTEFAEPGRASATISGKPGPREFSGTWRSGDAAVAIPIHLNRLDEKNNPRYLAEVYRESQGFAERAFRAMQSGNYQEASHYLRLYGVTNKNGPYVENWGEFLDARLSGKDEAFYQKARTCKQCPLLQDPLAYMLAERGEVAEAQRVYRTECRSHPNSLTEPPFTCLMWAALSEKKGDAIGRGEGYDFACDQLPFACARAFGPAEDQLIDEVRRGNAAVALRRLRESELNVNARHGKALSEAVLSNLIDVVRELLSHGADPDIGDLPLTLAILNKKPDIAMVLLDRGADPNLGNALHAAVEVNSLPLAEALIRKGADVNENAYLAGGTPLMYAAGDGKREMVKLLLQHGADPTIMAKFEGPALKLARDSEIRRMLQAAVAECKAGKRRCEQPQ
ncbi:MAG TPA: ankyrin repeat domain-containing protein [Bryobacteraceae bacterium]